MNTTFFSEAEASALRQGKIDNLRDGQQDLEWYAKRKTPVFFFGAGGYGRGLATIFVAKGGILAGFFDNNRALWKGVEVTGTPGTVPVYDPERAPAVLRAVPDSRCLLAVSPADAQVEILAQTERLGVELELFVPPYFPNPEAVDSPGPQQVYELLDDKRSRDIYRMVIRKRSGLDGATPLSYEAHQYYPEFMPRTCYRSFLDVGALDGDTFRRYLQRFGNEYDNYYAVEPNPNNFSMFHPGRDDQPKLRLFNLAASDAPGTLRMHDNHSTSHIVESGGVEVRADTLDNMIGVSPVSFIKMDIEGSEPAALHGAEGIIREQTPALAISIYHRLRHLWEIPLLIHDLHPEYKLRIRHHSRFITETICYAHT